MTWSEILEHLRASYVVLDERDGKVVLGWKLGGTYCTQTVELAGAFGEAWLRTTSEVGPRCDFSAEQALEHNLTLAIGGLAFTGDALVLVELTPLASLEKRQLERTVFLLAHEAARLRGHARPAERRAVVADQFAD